MHRISRRGTLFLSLATVAGVLGCHAGAGGSPGARVYDQAFWDHWSDGRAELAGYELAYPRYGEIRRGTAVAIFVTEPFSWSDRVKAEAPGRGEADVFPVLKLNLVQDFATGVYDYNLMTSAFVALRPVGGVAAGRPAKVTFSSQEWCGLVFSQLLFDADAVRHESRSYFDGEADRNDRLDGRVDGLAEDVLLVWARGLAAPSLSPGETRKVSLLRSLERARLGHVPVEWIDATVARSGATTRVSVPAGEFEVETLTVTATTPATRRTYGTGSVGPQRVEWTFLVERSFPHRLVRWSRSDGLDARLLGSTRAAYWSMGSEGYESALGDLGLTPRPARTP